MQKSLLATKIFLDNETEIFNIILGISHIEIGIFQGKTNLPPKFSTTQEQI